MKKFLIFTVSFILLITTAFLLVRPIETIEKQQRIIDESGILATVIRIYTYTGYDGFFVTVRKHEDGAKTVTWVLKESNHEIFTLIKQNIGEQLKFDIFGVDTPDEFVKEYVNIIDAYVP